MVKVCQGRWGSTKKREISYSYEVQGIQYVSATIHNGGFVDGESEAFQELLPNNKVIVYYSENSPAVSVLALDHPRPALTPIFAAILMSLATGLLALRW